MIVTSDPAIMEKVFVKDFHFFHDRPVSITEDSYHVLLCLQSFYIGS